MESPSSPTELRLADFDFEVPAHLVAQDPLPRGTSRMLVAPAGPPGSPLEHRNIADLASLLREGDCLVLNDTQVLNARIHGRLASGGMVELLLLDRQRQATGDCRWEVMARPGRKLPAGREIELPGNARAVVLEVQGDGTRIVRFDLDQGDFDSWLSRHGSVPLPPYVKREVTALDAERYQTRWARRPGAVAAPTAGLHLGDADLANIRDRGVSLTHVTLHVGAGTFLPISCENALEHPMHAETWELSEESARVLARTRAQGGRVVCVGTTALRTVETAFRQAGGRYEAGSGQTRLFLHPGDPPRSSQGLLTNFHWPRTTLVLLAAAWLGSRERWREVYESALAEGYRLFSYGDCMISFRE